MLASDGTVVHVHATPPRGYASDNPIEHPPPPHTAIAELVATYLGPVRRAGRGSLPSGTPEDEDAILRKAGFNGPDRFEVGGGEVLTRSADQVVAAVFSLSSSTPHLFGPSRGSFERDLRALLRQTSPDDLFAERRRDVALDIWRLPRPRPDRP